MASPSPYSVQLNGTFSDMVDEDRGEPVRWGALQQDRKESVVMLERRLSGCGCFNPRLDLGELGQEEYPERRRKR
jgi:hypothetical protein